LPPQQQWKKVLWYLKPGKQTETFALDLTDDKLIVDVLRPLAAQNVGHGIEELAIIG
jgi:hypothetical protein